MDDPNRITLTFEPKAVDYICAVLAQRPYGEVAQLLSDVNRQLLERQQQMLAAQAANGAGHAADAAPASTLPN